MCLSPILSSLYNEPCFRSTQFLPLPRFCLSATMDFLLPPQPYNAQWTWSPPQLPSSSLPASCSCCPPRSQAQSLSSSSSAQNYLPSWNRYMPSQPQLPQWQYAQAALPPLNVPSGSGTGSSRGLAHLAPDGPKSVPTLIPELGCKYHSIDLNPCRTYHPIVASFLGSSISAS